MSTAAAVIPVPKINDVLAMIKAMEPDTRRLLSGVSWTEYLAINEACSDTPNLQISFCDGVLEIMTVGFPHEKYSRLFSALLRTLAEELEIDVEEVGSTTLRLGSKQAGAEPDTAFYIQHAQQMIGKEQIRLGSDPPPDLVIEIDITNPSYHKDRLYAQFGVPEIWRFDGRGVAMIWLIESDYLPHEHSRAFPFLQASILASFIEQSLTEGQSKALRDFRVWVKTQEAPTLNNS